MRCDRTPPALVDRYLGVLHPADRGKLERHLESCPDCGRLEEEERLLTADLASLGSLPVRPVDVSSEVMCRIRRMGWAGRSPVPGRDMAWSASVAALAGMAVLALGFRLVPILPEAFRYGRALAVGLGVAVISVLRPLGPLLKLPASLAAPVIEVLDALAPSLDAAVRLTLAGTVLSLLIMTAVTTVVVGRDFLGRPASLDKER